MLQVITTIIGAVIGHWISPGWGTVIGGIAGWYLPVLLISLFAAAEQNSRSPAGSPSRTAETSASSETVETPWFPFCPPPDPERPREPGRTARIEFVGIPPEQRGKKCEAYCGCEQIATTTVIFSEETISWSKKYVLPYCDEHAGIVARYWDVGICDLCKEWVWHAEGRPFIETGDRTWEEGRDKRELYLSSCRQCDQKWSDGAITFEGLAKNRFVTNSSHELIVDGKKIRSGDEVEVHLTGDEWIPAKVGLARDDRTDNDDDDDDHYEDPTLIVDETKLMAFWEQQKSTRFLEEELSGFPWNARVRWPRTSRQP